MPGRFLFPRVTFLNNGVMNTPSSLFLITGIPVLEASQSTLILKNLRFSKKFCEPSVSKKSADKVSSRVLHPDAGQTHHFTWKRSCSHSLQTSLSEQSEISTSSENESDIRSCNACRDQMHGILLQDESFRVHQLTPARLTVVEREAAASPPPPRRHSEEEKIA